MLTPMQSALPISEVPLFAEEQFHLMLNQIPVYSQEQEQERSLQHRKAGDEAGQDAEHRAGLQREAAAEGLGQHPDRERAGPHA